MQRSTDLSTKIQILSKEERRNKRNYKEERQSSISRWLLKQRDRRNHISQRQLAHKTDSYADKIYKGLYTFSRINILLEEDSDKQVEQMDSYEETYNILDKNNDILYLLVKLKSINLSTLLKASHKKRTRR